MDTNTILNDASARMQKALDHLDEELLNVRAGKATPNVLNGVMVDYFGSQVPVSGAASVTVPDARTILIQPWDKNMIRPIEKAIIDSNIGLTPSNNGEQIRLSIPPLTEERRKELGFERSVKWDLRRWRVNHYDGRDGFWGETRDKNRFSNNSRFRFRGLYPFYSTEAKKYFFDAFFTTWVSNRTFEYNVIDYYFAIPGNEVVKSPVIDQQPNR